jgi:hypothetical protein
MSKDPETENFSFEEKRRYELLKYEKKNITNF